MRFALKWTLLLLIASCSGPGQDTGQDTGQGTSIESVVAHKDGGVCVKRSQGPLYCWGRYAGRDITTIGGIPNDNFSNSPQPVPLTGLNTANIVQMAATKHVLCARLASGTLQCWGGVSHTISLVSGPGTPPQIIGTYNNRVDVIPASWELGRGYELHNYTDLPGSVVGLGGGRGTLLNEVSSIAAGNDTFCAVFGEEGEVACWGSFGSESLKDNNPPLSASNPPSFSSDYRLGVDPSTLTIRGSTIMAVGTEYGLREQTNGSPAGQSVTVVGSSKPLAVEAADGASGNLRGAARVITGGVVLMRNGTMVTWSNGSTTGNTNYLGRGSLSIPNEHMVAPGKVVAPVGATGLFLEDVHIASASQHHICAAVGEVRTVYCWGENASGQMGDGSTSGKSTPIQVVPIRIGDLGRVLDIITPERKTCVINAQFEVFCWGDNTDTHGIHSLTEIQLKTPTRVFRGLRIVSLHNKSAGLCINYGDKLKCIGDNARGSHGASLGIGIEGALTGFGNGNNIYGDHPNETLAGAPFLKFPGLLE